MSGEIKLGAPLHDSAIAVQVVLFINLGAVIVWESCPNIT